MKRLKSEKGKRQICGYANLPFMMLFINQCLCRFFSKLTMFITVAEIDDETQRKP